MPKLYVLSGPDVGKSFEVAAGALVGRDPECVVRLRDPSVSRHHARVERGDLGWSIVDTQSRNGIHVEGRRVPQAALEDGAEFTLGEVLFRFRSDVASPAPMAGGTPIASHPPAAGNVPPAPPARPATVPEDEGEIVLEGDWEEPPIAAAAMARTAFAPPPRRSPEIAIEAPGRTHEVPGVQTPKRPVDPAGEPSVPRMGEGSAPKRAELAATETRVGVAHRAGGTASSSRSVLQYQRVVDRPGFVNADLAQQPLWIRLALALVALVLFAGVFWFAFKGTAFLKGKTQHEPADAQAEENG